MVRGGGAGGEEEADGGSGDKKCGLFPLPGGFGGGVGVGFRRRFSDRVASEEGGSVDQIGAEIMTGKEEQKSRKEKRKEARSEKHKLRFLSWVQHQGGKNKKTAVVSMEPSPAEEVKPKKEPKKRRREPEDSHKSKSKFQEYLEMEMGGAAVGREEDLEMERKLAKKLRVKKGKLGGPDDGMDDLFADLGFCGDYGSDGETEDTKPEKKKRKRKNKNLKDDAMEEGSGKVVDDSKVDKKKKKRKNKKVKDDASEEPGGGGVEMAEESDVSVHESEDEVLNAVETPPVSKAKYAAVFAAFIAGMTCLVGMDFSAKILSSLAKSFEDEYSKDDGLSVRNLMLLFSYLCIFDVIACDLVYDLLSVLSERLTELDVSTVLTILQCCGMKLRGDDPGAMKDFVLSIQNLMEFMLETICDIKNNKKRSKEDPSQHTRVKKWLQKLKSEDILLRGLKWSKLLDPEKKGQWWLSGDVSSTAGNVEDVAAVISKEVVEAQKLVHLAAAQRMNTDIRRAIFCIIMSAEDYVDAFDKILRLDLSGKQDREIMRVIVDCCLQEKTFNKYYTVLASKLCSHDKNHKFSLQYCIWDRFKELDEMELNRSMNLAKLVAEMLASFSLSLAALKVVNLANPVEMTPKKTMHFRMMFETLMQKEDSLMWNVFTRIVGNPELELLRDGIVMFVRQHVIAKDAGKELAGKFKIAKKALDNSAGVLM
uniref:Nucleolar MIF4G domain-containing protein 1 n=1 Tax=Aegilops tauschii TaxID=37682 RepID=M8BSR7_AEGTA